MTFYSTFFFTPDFIIYNPISMKTTPPTMTGTACLSIVSRSKYISQIAIAHNIPKRPIEAKPKIIKPIQNTKPFTPSNNLNHHYPKNPIIKMVHFSLNY